MSFAFLKISILGGVPSGVSHVPENLRYPGVVPKALTMLAALFGAGHTMSGDFCAKEAFQKNCEQKMFVGFFVVFVCFSNCLESRTKKLKRTVDKDY